MTARRKQPDPRTAVDSALDYAARGWEVFPAHSSGERKSHKSAEYSNGQPWGKTTDPDQIRADFRRWRKANVGIVTGAASGIFVLDADTIEGHGVDGIGSLRALEKTNEPLPETRMARSPTGSIHYYFKWPVGVVIHNSTSKVAPGHRRSRRGGNGPRPAVGSTGQEGRVPMARRARPGRCAAMADRPDRGRRARARSGSPTRTLRPTRPRSRRRSRSSPTPTSVGRSGTRSAWRSGPRPAARGSRPSTRGRRSRASTSRSRPWRGGSSSLDRRRPRSGPGPSSASPTSRPRRGSAPSTTSRSGS